MTIKTKEISKHGKQKPVKPERARDKRFETMQVNLSDKIKVVVNATTTVYISAGKDPEQVRQKYLNSMSPKIMRF